MEQRNGRNPGLLDDCVGQSTPLSPSAGHDADQKLTCVYWGWDFRGGSTVKNLPGMQQLQETWFPSLGEEGPPLRYSWASLVAQTVKNPPAMQGMWLQSLRREDLLEKVMAAQSSVLACRIPWTEEPGGLQSTGSQRVRHTKAAV